MSRVTSVTDRAVKMIYPECPVCHENCLKGETRMAELPAVYDKNSELYMRTYQAVGISYTHNTGKVCDRKLYDLTRV